MTFVKPNVGIWFKVSSVYISICQSKDENVRDSLVNHPVRTLHILTRFYINNTISRDQNMIYKEREPDSHIWLKYHLTIVLTSYIVLGFETGDDRITRLKPDYYMLH